MTQAIGMQNSASQRAAASVTEPLLHLGGRDPGRVLVTGARGFLGAAAVSLLRAQGVKVVASDIGESQAGDTRITPCDVTDFGQVETAIREGGFDTILHCGAVSGPMVMPDYPLDIWRINTGGTVHVLEAARRYGVGRVVICSTSEVYGTCSGHVDETTLPRPDSVYGASKLAAEQAMLGYVGEHGVDAIALRLSWIYGPGRTTPTSLEQAIRAGLQGRDAMMVAAPEAATHYIYIDDALQGLLRAATVATLDDRVFNITAGPAVPMSKVARLIEQMTANVTVGCKATANSAPGITHIDNSLAARALGFKVTVPLAEGLKRYRAALSESEL